MFVKPLLAAAIVMSAPFAHAAEGQAQAVPATTLNGKAAFVKPVTLRGKLGDGDIQVSLRTKEQMEDGVEGEYFYFGRSQNILLAGEIDGEYLFMEESENGTDVSGQWDGKLADNTISGEWQSADGKIKKPFTLRVVRTEEKAKQKSASNGKTAMPSRQ
ncbi:hypothetical protein [Noviherbaspirillum sp. Root189]|uniref:hypothetical protein n=1 Tax=Noviherbaspirillum sp. Root189 TaxID=1736487 RepID=UPI0009E7F0F8|nr:hypothetical protein [Noviherbaspirillum sp. Root189]